MAEPAERSGDATTALYTHFVKAKVAQVSNLLCRRLPVGKACEFSSACGLKIRDTADWKSALRDFIRPEHVCKAQVNAALLSARASRLSGFKRKIPFAIISSNCAIAD